MNRPGEIRDFERSIVKHAAPTLAGLKPASLFSCREPFARLEERFHDCRERLADKGISLDALAEREASTLLFVCRKSLVKAALCHDGTCRFMRSLGYDPTSVESCVACLSKRIALSDRKKITGCEFPHEIGLLLGYPFEDVMAFIRNDADCVACGCWKAYSNEAGARDQFKRYRACTAHLMRLFDEGARIEQLAQPAWAA